MDLSCFVVPLFSKSGRERRQFVHCATIVGPNLLATVLHDISDNPHDQYFVHFQDKFYLVSLLVKISKIDIAFLQISSSFVFPRFIHLSDANLKVLDTVIFVDINNQNSNITRQQRGTICSSDDCLQYTSGYTTYGGSCGGVVVSSTNPSQAIGIHSAMEHESKSSSSSDTSPSQPSKAKKRNLSYDELKHAHDELKEALKTERKKRHQLKSQKGSNPIFVKASTIITFLHQVGYQYNDGVLTATEPTRKRK